MNSYNSSSLAALNNESSYLSLLPKELSESNVLIRASFTADLFESKMLSLALCNVRKDANNHIVAEIPNKLLLDFIGCSRSNFYEKMKNYATLLVNTIIFAEDVKKKKFKVSVLVTDVEFADEEHTALKIKFNDTFENELLEVSKNFTKLPLNTLAECKTLAGYRLYENLASYCYYDSNYKGIKDGIFKVTFELDELRVLLGCVDVSHPEFGKFFTNGKKPDYKAIVKLADELAEVGVDRDGKKVFKRKYTRFSALNRDVIIPAIEEIEKISDLRVRYEEIKAGKGGAVVGIAFTITDLSIYKPEEEVIVEKTIVEMPEAELNQSFTSEFSYNDVMSVMKVANNDIGRVNKAYYYLLEYEKSHTVTNRIGVMISALQGNYEEATPYVQKKRSKDHGFTGRDYDWDNLEKTLWATD